MTARLAVVDDDEAFGTYLQTLFRTRGYEVDVYSSGGAFLEGLRAGPQPNVVLLDVMMPGVDGVKVAQTVRTLAAHKKVPIIFITAKDGPMDVVRGIQAGARSYITKPFKLPDVLAKVKKALGG